MVGSITTPTSWVIVIVGQPPSQDFVPSRSRHELITHLLSIHPNYSAYTLGVLTCTLNISAFTQVDASIDLHPWCVSLHLQHISLYSQHINLHLGGQACRHVPLVYWHPPQFPSRIFNKICPLTCISTLMSIITNILMVFLKLMMFFSSNFRMNYNILLILVV